MKDYFYHKKEALKVLTAWTRIKNLAYTSLVFFSFLTVIAAIYTISKHGK